MKQLLPIIAVILLVGTIASCSSKKQREDIITTKYEKPAPQGLSVRMTIRTPSSSDGLTVTIRVPLSAWPTTPCRGEGRDGTAVR